MSDSSKKLYVVVGPTAVGKTQFAIDLALSLDSSIVNADSRQVYTELSIGVNKPSSQQLSQAHHHLIGHRSITLPYDVSTFVQEATAILTQEFEAANTLILAGGTGLYVKALLEGLDEIPNVSEDIKAELNLRLKEEGLEALTKILKEKDPDYYEKVDLANPHRVLRALGVIETSGTPFSTFLNKKNNPEHLFDIEYIYINQDRDELRKVINKRVDDMLELGLENEVYSLREYRDYAALRTVGYQEWWPYFDGSMTRNECIDLIKIKTGQYAKRQQTWFNKYIPVPSLSLESVYQKYLGR